MNIHIESYRWLWLVSNERHGIECHITCKARPCVLLSRCPAFSLSVCLPVPIVPLSAVMYNNRRAYDWLELNDDDVISHVTHSAWKWRCCCCCCSDDDDDDDWSECLYILVVYEALKAFISQRHTDRQTITKWCTDCNISFSPFTLAGTDFRRVSQPWLRW